MIQNTVDTLLHQKNLPDDSLRDILDSDAFDSALQAAADGVRRQVYGDKVYIRGLIEFSNICTRNCLYCGIRAGNRNVDRYRLSDADILSCCESGYDLGFRTFVLQGGEDPQFSDARMVPLVESIRTHFPDCAITLSLGERSRESYAALFAAGANRYLLRHETANADHYARLHPENMSLQTRMSCLWNLKEIGFQVGAGMMVGSPFQTTDHLIEDLRFLQRLQPDMIGIGPFLHHAQTPLGKYPDGSFKRLCASFPFCGLCFHMH